MMLGLINLIVFVLCLGGLFAVVWGTLIYRSLVEGREGCVFALHKLQEQLEARYEMLPGLIETARGYMRHEKEALESVLSAAAVAATSLQTLRKASDKTGRFDSILEAEGSLSESVMRFFAISEAYPELKADPRMRQLVQSFLGREAAVEDCRAAFNEAVARFNRSRSEFPGGYVARLMRIGEMVGFEKSSGAEGED
jgi:LemA protein